MLHPVPVVQWAKLNWEWESRSPCDDLLLDLLDLWDTLSNLGLEVLELVGLLWQLGLNFLCDVDQLVDVPNDPLKVLLSESAAGHSWGADTDTAGCQSRLITGDRVLVASNVGVLENGLDTGTIKTLWTKVEENHVTVSSARDESVTESLEFRFASFGVLDDLLLVLLELWSEGLAKSNGESGDGVVVRTTLVTREDTEVDSVLEPVESLLTLSINRPDTLSVEDHSTTRTSQALVGGSSDNISVFERRWDHTGSDQTGDVGHVNDKVSSNGVSDLTHSSVVDETAVGTGSGNQDLWTV